MSHSTNLYCAFNGLGKTELCKKHSDYVDLDESLFLSTKTEKQFAEVVKSNIAVGKKVLASAAGWTLYACKIAELCPIVILPIQTKETKTAILERIKTRDLVFYQSFKARYDQAYAMTKGTAELFGYPIIYMTADQYLTDLLIGEEA